MSKLNSQMELVTDWISDVDEQLEEDEQVDGAMDSLLEQEPGDRAVERGGNPDG